MDDTKPKSGAPRPVDRRTLLSTSVSAAMTGGLFCGYGAFAAVAGRFLYPTAEGNQGWVFVAELLSMQPGDSLVFRTPTGATATIARSRRGDASDFIALSSTCPHLGCRVIWEPQQSRFFCPCHNGTFAPSGKATGGPPAKAGQSLKPYPLKVAGGLLFIQVPLAELARGEESPRSPPSRGHDPCLSFWKKKA